MNILLICSAGMSTSLLEKSILDYMKDNSIKGNVEALGSYAAQPKIKEFDILLLGPQVRFMKSKYEKLCDKPVFIIPSLDFALAKGENVYKFALKEYNNFKNK